ncbi:MAG TPA: sensor domain-containing diguanylate cyclase, partial [Chthonomonadales bacterium]|nr:sensor domain-containing diguanylate cyclase [Chthonomonadales bacterium]
VGLGHLGTRYARRRYAEPVFRAQAVAYAASFPFAMAMIFAYRSFGLGAVPYLAAMLLVCAHAVRMTIENRALRRQLWAVEALGRTCESGTREEMPLERFLALAHELVAFERAVIWLAEEGSSALRPRVVWPLAALPPDPAEAGPDTLLDRMCHRSTPLLVSDIRLDPRQPIGARSASWLLFPILLHGRSIGVAQFIRSARRPFTRQDKQRLASLIPQAALAFESVRLRHLMHRYANMATMDSLTGLLNHRRAQEVLRVELRRAQRYGRPLAVMMLDVDGFKQFNDTYGHPQGDLLLQSIARILRANVRSVDHIGRYGGEEFIVILPETSYPEACALAERIRKAVENTPFTTGDGRAIRKTVSIGLAAYAHDMKTATELLQQADNALYRAKRAGKNRVLVA